jgi:hypothetical protein
MVITLSLLLFIGFAGMGWWMGVFPRKKKSPELPPYQEGDHSVITTKLLPSPEPIDYEELFKECAKPLVKRFAEERLDIERSMKAAFKYIGSLPEADHWLVGGADFGVASNRYFEKMATLFIELCTRNSITVSRTSGYVKVDGDSFRAYCERLAMGNGQEIPEEMRAQLKMGVYR